MFDDILSAFRARPVPGHGDCFKGFCPLHKCGCERRPSVSLRVDGDRLLIRCFVCGRDATPRVVEAAGFRMCQLFSDYGQKGKARSRVGLKPTAEFVYEDEEGRPLYKAVRYDYPPDGGKGFMQSRWDADKAAWLPGIGPEPGVPGAAFTTRRVPYRLPLLLKDPKQPVLVVEGEAKADLLVSWGLTATCGVGGTGMGWRDSYSKFLAGRRVAVLPDNDPPGHRHAYAVAGSLIYNGAAGVRIVALPGLPEAGDVIDFAKAGGTRDQLLAHIRNTPEWKPSC